MIQLFIKEDYMSFQNRMLVKNQTGQDVFLIVGKWGRIGDALSLYSLDGTRLVEAKQKTLSVFPVFNLTVKNQPMGKITKYPGFPGIYNPYYKLDKLNWTITGDFKERRYTAKHGAKKIMDVNKSFTSFGDFYSLIIYEDQSAPLCCLISVIIEHYSPIRQSPSRSLLNEADTI